VSEHIRKKIADLRKFDKEIRPPFPRELMLEIVNYCNQKCRFCAIRKSTRKKKKADPGKFSEFMRDAFENGARIVGLHGGAEPFLHGGVEEYIAIAKKIGYEYVYLSTNGSMADGGRLSRCFANGLDSIKFSVNATTRDDYRRVHGVDSFERVLHHIGAGYEIREANDYKTYISVSVVCERTDGTAEKELKKLLKGRVDEVVEVPLMNQSGQITGVRAGGETLPCYMPFRRLNITVEGYLRACCSDYQNYLAAADLNEMPISEAFYGHVMTGLRKMHLSGSIKGTLCERCAFSSRTIPKPLNARLATVDPSFFRE
jgi:MoaA/NifB/PqqE/SkfB family radical SAM enzyme